MKLTSGAGLETARLQLMRSVLRTQGPTGRADEPMIIAGVASALVLTASQLITFPGDRIEVAGPDGRFSVVWVAADQSPSGEHQLLLKDNPSGSSTLLLHFGRSVTVAWSPNGRRLAVTNRVGSDSAETWVYSVDGTPPTSVWGLLKLQQGKRRLAFTAGAHHMYVEADRWLSDASLSVRAWGYGGPRPFDKRFRGTLSE